MYLVRRVIGFDNAASLYVLEPAEFQSTFYPQWYLAPAQSLIMCDHPDVYIEYKESGDIHR